MKNTPEAKAIWNNIEKVASTAPKFKPSMPVPPTEPTPPTKTLKIQEMVDSQYLYTIDGEYEDVTDALTRLLSHGHKVNLRISRDYYDNEPSYYLEVFKYADVENNQYDKQYKSYEKKMEKYRNSLKLYESKLEKYKKDLAAYTDWKNQKERESELALLKKLKAKYNQ